MASTSVDLDFGLTDPSTWIPAAMRVGGYAVGTGTPAEQITASTLVIVLAAASSALTFGITLFVVLLALPFLAVGLLRLVPAVNERWPL
jgi:hypothetical protein